MPLPIWQSPPDPRFGHADPFKIIRHFWGCKIPVTGLKKKKKTAHQLVYFCLV
jgi:hypothetical protein